PRRLYTSRAFSRACSAVAACTLPACSCGAPLGGCRNTSHSGHCESAAAGEVDGAGSPPDASFAIVSRRRGGARLVFRGVRRRGSPDPCTIVVCFAPCGHALAIARPVPPHNPPELVPVDHTELPVPARLVVREIGIGKREVDRLCLRNGEIDEPLAKLIVRL